MENTPQCPAHCPAQCPPQCPPVTGNYRCHFELTLQLIGGKWKLLVIYFLSLQKVIRFGQLRRTLPEISERMLVRQLRELEDDGLVSRKVYGTVPPRVDYALTPLGESLVPIMESLKTWGNMYELSRKQAGVYSGHAPDHTPDHAQKLAQELAE